MPCLYISPPNKKTEARHRWPRLCLIVRFALFASCQSEHHLLGILACPHDVHAGVEVVHGNACAVEHGGHHPCAEGVVDFRYGENEQVMSLVLKYQESGVVFATEFSYRQMYQLKSDGTFHASGGEDTDGWYRLVWENMSWVMERVPEEENCESKPDAPWQIYESAQVQE